MDNSKIKDINELATQLIKNFVDAIGYDGEEYVNMEKQPPILFINNNILEYINACGKYFSPSDITSIYNIINKKDINSDILKKIKNVGYIGILKKNNTDENELLMTLIHERFHYNRNFLVNDVNLKNDYVFDKDKFVQINDKCIEQYVDLNQDIFKGSIDNSKKTINKYKLLTDSEIENIQFKYEENDENYYINVDETLVELMAYLSVAMYLKPKLSLMQHIENLSEIELDEEYDINDIRMINMCKIIVKHQDFELFKWMINPMDYIMGDIHYDFFKKYTNHDELVNVFEFAEEDDYMDIDHVLIKK